MKRMWNMSEWHCQFYINTGVYIRAHSPLLTKGDADGKGRGKKKKNENLKKGNLKKISILAVPNDKIWLVQHNLTLFKP